MKKKNVLLDLDETIISAISIDKFDEQTYKDKMKLFKHYDMDGYYYVFERPGLEEFLDYVFKNFNVSVWTAASKDYALFIIEKIILVKPERKLDYIFFSYHCDVSKKLNDGIKNLTTLWDIFKLPGYNANNTVIIDDNKDVWKTGFCIPVQEFVFTEESSELDTELQSVIKKLESRK
jgi:TFIIF-interacting CTD phosphatase-like protein